MCDILKLLLLSKRFYQVILRRPLIKDFESPLIFPSGSLDFVLDDPAVRYGPIADITLHGARSY
jgi:hypothetical protein